MTQAPKEIKELVKRFEDNLKAYKSGSYKEDQLRQEFINPFFEALGWDMENKAGVAPQYRDVIHEDSIRVAKGTKAPDYAFTLAGRKIFFVEAKKPSVDIKHDTHPAYQLRRYAWSAGLPLSILTDFEEFAVYESRKRPDKNDKASTERIMYLTYKDYIERWDEIYSIFSKDAVLKGSFDRFAEEAKNKRGTAKVDEEFLKEIEQWRTEFARNIALRNSYLTVKELNYAVQRTIDRIIFLRMCEDMGAERYGQLLKATEKEDIYSSLLKLYKKADAKYNSGLFHFKKEKGRATHPDDITPNITIDDKVLKKIIKGLYYPDSPYEFSVLSPEILGNVYEQFLGKVIRLTAGHRAKVEEKPEVKKAGGVYYTPQYIVEYIVENTVGKLCKGKTPNQLEELRILDPACGSGSFLLGAYTYLLNYHLDHYTKAKNPKKYKDKVYQDKNGEWRLTIREKKRILLNNIYGVDIDEQAVEVTKLSLLLKVLEGENRDVLEAQKKLWQERALPDLGNNIKCGNSLIGPDFYTSSGGVQTTLFDDDEMDRINVFDWETEFKDIMERGGFDAVIGNPPYIPIELMKTEEKEYYQHKFHQLERKYDSSIVFILSMKQKLSKKGFLGFISSITWQTGENYSKLREHLFNNGGVVSLVNLPFDVFKNAYVDTGIYILSNTKRDGYTIFRYPKKAKIQHLTDITFKKVPSKLIRPPKYRIVLNPKAEVILSRAREKASFVPLGEISISTQGLAGNRFERSSTDFQEAYPFLEKGQVYRYSFESDKITYTSLEDKASLKKYYAAEPKILIRRVINRQDRLMATYINQKLVFKKDINPFILKDTPLRPLFVLSILNSRLISYLYVNTSSIATKDDFRQTTLAELREIPIRTLNLSDPNDKKMHDDMVKMVEKNLDLHKRLAEAKTPNEKERIQRQIDAIDRAIDSLVYELYGLTDEEIKIVEGQE